MAAIQQTPITFQSRSPPKFGLRLSKPVNLSFTGNMALLKLPVLNINRKSKSTPTSSCPKMADSAASSYAAALVDVATSNGTLDTTISDLEKLEKIFSDQATNDFFVNPIIEIEKKSKVVEEIAESANLQPHVTNFLKILLDMKRLDLFKEIVKEFELAYNQATDTELAVVTSVVQLDSQHLAQIAKGVQRLTGAKNVRIKTLIDPSLVAGFTIRYGHSGSRLIDMSVKKQLEEISEQLEVSDISFAPAV